MKTWILLVLAFCGGLAFAEGEGIIRRMNDCIANAASDSEGLQCAREGYIDADNLLNSRWRSYLSIMRSREIAALTRNQKMWLYDTRNSTCQGDPDTGRNFEGSAIDTDGWVCMARLTVKRINWLRAERGY